jgi:hypothetical protein
VLSRLQKKASRRVINAALTKRAFVHDVRTFAADEGSEKKLEKIRELMGSDRTIQEAGEDDKAA